MMTVKATEEFSSDDDMCLKQQMNSPVTMICVFLHYYKSGNKKKGILFQESRHGNAYMYNGIDIAIFEQIP
jgi:hypothetical protein